MINKVKALYVVLNSKGSYQASYLSRKGAEYFRDYWNKFEHLENGPYRIVKYIPAPKKK